MKVRKQQDLAAVVAAIVAQAPPLSRDQAFALSALLYPAAATCERRPAQAAAAPADTAAVQSVGDRDAG